MKLLSVIFAVLLTCIQGYHINYQAHGFNDLDYFIQLLQKGVSIFKFDVNLAIKESCLKHTTWHEGDNECEQLKYGMPTCCLVFRGDTSSVPIWDYAANTTSDFIKIFSSGKYDYILSKENALPRYKEKKIIAINHQYGPYVFNNLTQTFTYQLFKAINDRNLNIEIIFGREDFITQYDNKCAKGECNDVEQYISDFPVSLQSNQYELPKLVKPRRFNFNTNYVTIEGFCKVGFPSWVDPQNEFPMIFWEPSHEEGMSWCFKQWFNSTCKIPAWKSKKSDYQQANNQDPEMQQVFLQGVNVTYSGEKHLFRNKINTALDYFEDQKTYLFGYTNAQDGQHYIELVNEDSIQAYYTIEVQEQIEYLKSIKFGNVYIIMAQHLTFLSLYQFDPESKKIIRLQTENIALKWEQDIFLASDIIQSALEKSDYFFVMLMYAHTSETIKSKVIKINTKGVQVTDSISQFIVQHLGVNMMDATTADVAFKNGQGMLLFNVKGLKSQIYPFFFQITIMFGGEYNFKSYNFSKHYFKNTRLNGGYEYLAFGQRPVVRMYLDDKNQLFALVTTTNAISQSGVYLNNNDFNKCNYQAYQGFEQLLNLKYNMNYFYGKLQSMKDKFSQGQLINSCTNNIHHASYNNGNRPSIVLKKSNIDAEDYYTAVVLHEYVDYYYLPGPTKLFCGANGVYNNIEGRSNEKEIIQNSSMLTYFSLVPFEIFDHF